MWICNRCHEENRENAAVCENCGAVRANGRFSSNVRQGYRAAQPPRVTAPVQVPEQKPAPASARAPERAPERYEEEPPEEKSAHGFSRLVGGLLCFLLPALTALLAWRQQEVLRAVVTPLWTGLDAPAWMEWACFGGVTLAALLLSLLPGLWTLLLAHKKE